MKAGESEAITSGLQSYDDTTGATRRHEEMNQMLS